MVLVAEVLSLHLVLSFLVGGLFVNFALFLMEHFENFGVFVGGLPSTAAFSFFFIGWVVSVPTVVAATTDFPVFVGLAGTFLLCYTYLAGRTGFAAALIGSLAIWFVATLSVAFSGFENFALSIIAWVLISLGVYFGFRRLRLGRPTLQPQATGPQRLLRFVLGGGTVVAAVLASQFGGVFGGVFSAAPAVFTSSLIAIKIGSNTDSTRRVTMPLMVSAWVTLVPYSIFVRYLYPILGIGYGTLVAYSMAAIIGTVYFGVARERIFP
jgi:Protein of unknown function (DUF3147)